MQLPFNSNKKYPIAYLPSYHTICLLHSCVKKGAFYISPLTTFNRLLNRRAACSLFWFKKYFVIKNNSKFNPKFFQELCRDYEAWMFHFKLFLICLCPNLASCSENAFFITLRLAVIAYYQTNPYTSLLQYIYCTIVNMHKQWHSQSSNTHPNSFKQAICGSHMKQHCCGYCSMGVPLRVL